jgi:hypothetical protein
MSDRSIRILALLAGLGAAGCDTPGGYYAKTYSEFRPSRPAETVSENAGWREIVFWAKDPSRKELAGYLETRDVAPKGSLNAVRQYFVHDLNGNQIGYIDEYGIAYVWRDGGAPGNGRWERSGEYSVDGAVKALFKRSYRMNVGFEPMEYRPEMLYTVE